MVNFNRFNQGRIVIPDKHFGDPMRLLGAYGNPFDDLDRASGCDDPDPALAQIGDLTREVQRGVLAVTLLTRGLVNSNNPDDVFSFIGKEVASRVGDGLFFACSDTGEDFFQGKVGFGSLQNIGSYEEAIRQALLERRNMALDTADRHDEFALDLIDSPRGGVILETGAGADFARIKKIQGYAQSVGARLICHDTAPLASRASVDHLDGVPYLSLPSSSELLSLPFADTGQPLTITLKDVVSSMAFGQINELCEVAKNAKARKILVTQSLGLAHESNMIPESWRFDGRQFAMYVASKFAGDLLSDYGLIQIQPILAYISLQVQHIIDVIMIELAKRWMRRSASQIAGLNVDRVINVEDGSVLNARAAGEYLSRFHPGLMPEFLSGKFNKIASGPFGTTLSKDSSVRANGLRVSTWRTHWEFTRGNIADIRPGKKTPDRSVTFGLANKINVPGEFLAVNRNFEIGQLRQAGADVEVLSALPDDKIRRFHKMGAEAALDIIFNVWGRGLGHYGVKPFLGQVEEEMHRVFMKDI